MLIWIPIEPLEERYSAQWAVWFEAEFKRLRIDFKTINTTPLRKYIKDGAFLDVISTSYFKHVQLVKIIGMIERKEIKTGDVLLVADLWYPGLETLFYIRDGLGIDFKIVGLLHAGTYDPNDFLTQKGMERWAKYAETCWFCGVDLIFVATEYHKHLLARRLPIAHLVDKVVVTPFPLMLDNMQGHENNWHDYTKAPVKENIVVFPHRLAPEKQPDLFDRVASLLAPNMPGWTFVKTKDVCKTKPEYYAMLARSKVAVSFALQETWGIALQESLHYDCIPVVPDRLSYQELFPPPFRYHNVEEAVVTIRHCADNYDSIVGSEGYKVMQETNRWRNHSAIGRMVQIMREKGYRI